MSPLSRALRPVLLVLLLLTFTGVGHAADPPSGDLATSIQNVIIDLKDAQRQVGSQSPPQLEKAIKDLADIKKGLPLTGAASSGTGTNPGNAPGTQGKESDPGKGRAPSLLDNLSSTAIAVFLSLIAIVGCWIVWSHFIKPWREKSSAGVTPDAAKLASVTLRAAPSPPAKFPQEKEIQPPNDVQSRQNAKVFGEMQAGIRDLSELCKDINEDVKRSARIKDIEERVSQAFGVVDGRIQRVDARLEATEEEQKQARADQARLLSEATAQLGAVNQNIFRLNNVIQETEKRLTGNQALQNYERMPLGRDRFEEAFRSLQQALLGSGMPARALAPIELAARQLDIFKEFNIAGGSQSIDAGWLNEPANLARLRQGLFTRSTLMYAPLMLNDQQLRLVGSLRQELELYQRFLLDKLEKVSGARPIAPIPEQDAFDPSQHQEQGERIKTGDSGLHNRIQQVLMPGIEARGQVLEKARVVCYGQI